MRKLLTFVLLSLSFVSHGESTEWVRVNHGATFCKRASQTFIMQDAKACGKSTVFCNTPLECYWGFGGRSAGMVSCKAKRMKVVSRDPKEDFTLGSSAIKANGADLVCPASLQQCADDPQPVVATEGNMAQFTDGVVSLESTSRQPEKAAAVGGSHQ